MEAKLSNKVFQLTGTGVSYALSVVLLLAALLWDAASGHFLALNQSLSLPLGICAVLVAALGYQAVPWLRALKAGQVIREDGPQSHLKKAGTPTMGGIFFIPVGVVVALLWSGLNAHVLAVSLLTFSYGAIGWLDDWMILRRRSNKGISPKAKLALQIAFGVTFTVWLLATSFDTVTQVMLPIGAIALGWLFLPLAVFVLVAEGNATNLTDGLDGLAAGTGAIAFLGFALLLSPTEPAMATFCACMAGSCLGFLAHNRNRASVFMGDTGSLAIGGALAATGLVTGTLWSLFLLGGVFFIESVSVILQVSYYKATKDGNGIGKRLFKMAPIHHHLELSGWSEIKVVMALYLAGLLFASLALVLR